MQFLLVGFLVGFGNFARGSRLANSSLPREESTEVTRIKAASRKGEKLPSFSMNLANFFRAVL
jgi:hypothetical protein